MSHIYFSKLFVGPIFRPFCF